MSSIHFKFRSSLEFDTITFDGPGISLSDLRESIVAKKKIARSTDYTLEITNAQNKQVYTDESVFIPKNTSVIVKRVPVKRATSAAKSHLEDKATKENMSLEKLSKTADLANANASEQDKIKAMMSQSGEEWQPSQYVRKSVPHVRYTCFKCGQQGHYIRDCPNSGPMDKSMIIHRDKRGRNAGIPKDYVPPVTVSDSPRFNQDNTRSYSPVVSSDVVDPAKVPPELQCPMCAQLFTDAVVVPCCGTSYCDECIRNHLLENDLVCPSCQETTSPDNLIANKLLRTSCSNFRNRRKPQSVSLPAAVNNNNGISIQKPLDVIKTEPIQTPTAVSSVDVVPLSINGTPNDLAPKTTASPLHVASPIIKEVADSVVSPPQSNNDNNTPSGSSSSRSASSSGSSSDGSDSGSEATRTPESATPTSTTATSTTSKPINADIAKAIHADIAALSRDALLPASSRSVTSLHAQHLPPIVTGAGYPHSSMPLHRPMPGLKHPGALSLLDPMFHPALMHENPYLHVDPSMLHLGQMDPYYDVERGGAGMPLSIEEFYRTQEILHHSNRHHDDRHRDGSSERSSRKPSRRTYKHSGSDYEYRSSRSDRSDRKHYSSSVHSKRRSPKHSSDDSRARSPGRSRSPRYRRDDDKSRRSRKRRSRSPAVKKASIKKVRSASPQIKSIVKSESSDDLRNQISASKNNRIKKESKSNDQEASSRHRKSEQILKDQPEKRHQSDPESKRKHDKSSSKHEKSRLADDKKYTTDDEDIKKQRKTKETGRRVIKLAKENDAQTVGNDDKVKQAKDEERRKRKHSDDSQKVKRRRGSKSDIVVIKQKDIDKTDIRSTIRRETKDRSDDVLSNDDNKTLVRSAVEPVEPDSACRRESIDSPRITSDDELAKGTMKHRGASSLNDQDADRLDEGDNDAIVSTEASPSLLVDNDEGDSIHDGDRVDSVEMKCDSKPSKKKKKHKNKHKRKHKKKGHGASDNEGAQSDGKVDEERSKRKHKKHKRKHHKGTDNENISKTKKSKD